MEAAKALDTAYEISKLLDCGLDKESLSICIALIENGVNPEALAEVVSRLRKQAAESARQQANTRSGAVNGEAAGR